MKMNQANQLIVKEHDVIDALYQQRTIDRTIIVEDNKWVDRFNQLTELFDFPESRINYEIASQLSSSEFVEACLENWNMPAEYQALSVWNYLMDRCDTQEQRDRVEMEFQEFEKRNMLTVLKFLIYFIDKLKENKIVWGVGRGSSVASYVLFLIGVHRIDSIKYDLDIKEFLK